MAAMSTRFLAVRLALLSAVLPLAFAAAAGAQNGAPAAPRSAASIDWLEVRSRSDAFGGRSFGRVGVYETIVAVAHGRLDPTAAANAAIVDLARAPRTDGYVDYQVDVVILRPTVAANARRVLSTTW
jgi:hypothetical protein